MKAISLWQPWASAMALGLKKNETRGWATGYRGELAICSAKRPMDNLGREIARQNGILYEPMGYGHVLCVVELYDCVPSAEFHGSTPRQISETEAGLGDYSVCRWIWLTRDLRKLKWSVPIVGRQNLWKLIY